MQFRTDIELKVVEIQNSNDSTLELCNSLMGIYSKEKYAKPFQAEYDLYQEEQKFIYQAYIQTETERLLGQAMISYL